MPDWDKIKDEKQRSISLCEARNGAVLLLKAKDIDANDFNDLYKETVRKLFKLKSLTQENMDMLRNYVLEKMSLLIRNIYKSLHITHT